MSQPTTTAPHVPAPGRASPNGDAPNGKPKVKKLRLLLLLVGISLLAMVSTVFGMMMAVASDLPQLENRAEYRRSENSTLFAAGRGNPELAKLTGNQNRILLKDSEISANIKNAAIAIEDRRFYEHDGVDYKGIARALSQDILSRGAVQGGSTITQQFVKNALAAQANRSVFQKLREAALAYHLERKWTKQKVLTEYLNSIYFGNGAYGVEAAARTYFGDRATTDSTSPSGLVPASSGTDPATELKEKAASDVTPAEAALLAGMIASPSLYDPVEHPRRSKHRRDQVLRNMLDQRTISLSQYRDAVGTVLPTEDEIRPPQAESRQPYFTSWLTQQLVDRYRAPAVFSGGLDVKTTLDPELQASAEQAINGRLAGVGPSASLVAIENKTGEVKAMVGGADFSKKPFNLATNGHRQPGSSFKPFTLIRALEDGVSPDATFTSKKKIFPVPNGGQEKFVVNNYDDSYSGIASLRTATARSDNSVFAELGLRVGTKRIARLAQRMGVRTPVSTNPAMTLGGLKEGLTPLELAFAYTTIANKGMRVSGSLSSSPGGPVAIEKVDGAGRDDENHRVAKRVFPEKVGEVTQQLLAGVIQGGTGRAAQIGELIAGKTGTTENYGDAWFVGFNKDLTVAVWVGYPDQLKYMKTEYHGSPVAGGTFPTEIWHDFMLRWIGIRDQREAESGKGKDKGDQPAVPVTPYQQAPSGPQGTQTAPDQGAGTPQTPKQPQRQPSKKQPQPTQPRQQTPAAPQTPTPAPPAGGAPQGGAAPG
jgi:penicillin-binding protein 1A